MKKYLIIIFCFLSIFSCYNKNISDEESIDNQYYNELFKEYIINENSSVGTVDFRDDTSVGGQGICFLEDSMPLLCYDLPAKLFRGDIDSDGKDDIIMSSFMTGGGGGGNIGWTEYFILYGNKNEFQTFPRGNRSDFINPTKNIQCPEPTGYFEYFSIDSVSQSYIYGKVQHCIFFPRDAFWKGWDNIYEEKNVKCILINNKLKIIEIIEVVNRFEWVPWIETHFKDSLLYFSDKHEKLFNGIIYRNYDFDEQTKELELKYVNGKIVSRRSWYESGQLYEDISYRDRKIISSKYWDEDKNEIK